MEFDAVLIEPRLKEMTEKGFWHDKTPNDFFDRCLIGTPDKLAVASVKVETGARTDLTYRQLDRLARRAAVGLTRLGVVSGDVVTCQLPNGWEFVVTYLACTRVGAVFNPVMHIFRERELEFILGHGESKVFVVPALFRGFDHAAMAEELKAKMPNLEHTVVVDGTGKNSFDTLLLDPDFDDAEFTETRRGPNEVCELIYTSGTTGEPKGVMHTANTIHANLIPFAERLRLGESDVFLMASPMGHQTGFAYGLVLSIQANASTILMDSWDKNIAARLIESDGVTFTMASTPFLMDLTAAVEETGADTSSLRVFLCSGTTIPGPVVDRAQKSLGASIISAWGMSENGAVAMISPDDPPERAVTTDGFPLPGVEIQIRDEAGRPVGPDTEGNLFLRSCSNFGGYLKRPHLNDVDEDGWFNTGDRARQGADGYIRICGRSKDIIIRGAENIPVVEVEAILIRHPSVATVAVVGYPDERLGERACAFVTLAAGREFSFDAMQAYLAEQKLAKQYWPERLEIRDALPSTASGKIQKFVLRTMLTEKADR